jgi:hypothetical protein
MLVIAAITDPDRNACESVSEWFCVWRIFAGNRRDRGKHGGLTAGKSPNTVGSDAESSEQRPAANDAGCGQAFHDSLNGHQGGMLPEAIRLWRNDKERKEAWVMKQLVVRLFDLTRKAAAGGDCCERLQASIPTFPEAVQEHDRRPRWSRCAGRRVAPPDSEISQRPAAGIARRVHLSPEGTPLMPARRMREQPSIGTRS